MSPWTIPLVPNIISVCRPIFWSLLLGTYLCTGLKHIEITPYWFYPQNFHFYTWDHSSKYVYVISTKKSIGNEVRRQPIIENTTMENFNLNILLYVYLQMVIYITHTNIIYTKKYVSLKIWKLDRKNWLLSIFKLIQYYDIYSIQDDSPSVLTSIYPEIMKLLIIKNYLY